MNIDGTTIYMEILARKKIKKKEKIEQVLLNVLMPACIFPLKTRQAKNKIYTEKYKEN